MKGLLHRIRNSFKEPEANVKVADDGQNSGATLSGAEAACEATGCADTLALDLLRAIFQHLASPSGGGTRSFLAARATCKRWLEAAACVPLTVVLPSSSLPAEQELAIQELVRRPPTLTVGGVVVTFPHSSTFRRDNHSQKGGRVFTWAAQLGTLKALGPDLTHVTVVSPALDGSAACWWARRLALLPGLRSLSIRGGWHPALSTGLWDRRGLSREPSHSRAESESERVLRHVLAPLPHLNALDVPVLSCSDVQVIAGQLPRLESLTLRLGPQQGVSSSAGGYLAPLASGPPVFHQPVAWASLPNRLKHLTTLRVIASSPDHALPSSCVAALSDSTSLQECELDVRCDLDQGSHLIWGMTALKRLAISVVLEHSFSNSAGNTALQHLPAQQQPQQAAATSLARFLAAVGTTVAAHGAPPPLLWMGPPGAASAGVVQQPWASSSCSRFGTSQKLQSTKVMNAAGTGTDTVPGCTTVVEVELDCSRALAWLDLVPDAAWGVLLQGGTSQLSSRNGHPGATGSQVICHAPHQQPVMPARRWELHLTLRCGNADLLRGCSPGPASSSRFSGGGGAGTGSAGGVRHVLVNRWWAPALPLGCMLGGSTPELGYRYPGSHTQETSAEAGLLQRAAAEDDDGSGPQGHQVQPRPPAAGFHHHLARLNLVGMTVALQDLVPLLAGSPTGATAASAAAGEGTPLRHLELHACRLLGWKTMAAEGEEVGATSEAVGGLQQQQEKRQHAGNEQSVQGAGVDVQLQQQRVSSQAQAGVEVVSSSQGTQSAVAGDARRQQEGGGSGGQIGAGPAVVVAGAASGRKPASGSETAAAPPSQPPPAARVLPAPPSYTQQQQQHRPQSDLAGAVAVLPYCPCLRVLRIRLAPEDAAVWTPALVEQLHARLPGLQTWSVRPLVT